MRSSDSLHLKHALSSFAGVLGFDYHGMDGVHGPILALRRDAFRFAAYADVIASSIASSYSASDGLNAGHFRAASGMASIFSALQRELS